MSDFSFPKYFNLFNTVGFITLYRKEVMRFMNVYIQTVLTPAITSLMFLLIFSLALGRAVYDINGVPFSSFLAPGLIMMAMAQSAFANTSSSIVVSKIQGNIVDVLMPPITAFEFLLAYIFAAVTRALIVGFITTVIMFFAVDISIVDLWVILVFSVLGSVFLGILGIIGGIWAEKFDHIAAVTNFLVAPMTFLSGTFYSITRLPDPFYTMSQYNPFFYMIDGFRSGFIGTADASISFGIILLGLVDIVLLVIAFFMLKSGYKLRS